MKHVYFARIVVLFVALSIGSAASQDIGNMTQTIRVYQGVFPFLQIHGTLGTQCLF
jgi:hypothetical protein